MDIASIVNTVGVVGVVAAMVGAVVALMERTHRRTRHLSRAPFGADLSSDSDLRRTRDELRAVEGREAGRPTREGDSHTPPESYTAPSGAQRQDAAPTFPAARRICSSPKPSGA